MRTLVVGYGNELRGDDAVGPLVARGVSEWGLAEVRCLDVHQLTPELVEELAGVDRVIFIDACLDGEQTRLEELSGGGAAPGGHLSDPRGLLALCAVLHGRAPRAWLITVPVAGLEVGVRLSPRAEQGMARALTLMHKTLMFEPMIGT